MKVYIDSADLGGIERAAALGDVVGVTLNPNLHAESRAGLLRS
jgi:transaldolase